MATRVLLFGAPAIEQDGTLSALPFERSSQLLVLLAHRRAWIARHELAGLLWPGLERRLALTNLRKAVFRLQARPWGDVLEAQASAVRVVADTDVADFEAALGEDRQADALALRRGEWLQGFDDDANEAWSSWLRFERDRLRGAWRSAVLERLQADIDPVDGIALAARLLDADPLDESALRALMSLLTRSGQTARARQAYREFSDRLAEELGLAPAAQLQAIYDGLGAVAPAAAPTPGAAGFVGRVAERRAIAELLARGDVRLLCLMGPGGVGKTRLAQRVLQDMAGTLGQDLAFVPLDDLESASEVPARIARELDIALQGREPPLEQLSAAMRERRTLLVLDNFEQLANDAALLEGLLAACPHVKLIVTSRVRLCLPSEQLFPLDGLPCPEPEDGDRVGAFDAARLFIAAAQRVEPGFQGSSDGAAIVDICRLVDGLPLALELAAAWTRALSCQDIAAQLRAGTELLRAGSAGHPARHASMEVVFEQSWRRLVPAEREALGRLAVFRGSFTVDAARAVAAVALPVLSALSDKSLLRKDGARLALHPLVQQLAARKLAQSPANGKTQAAHAAYFHHRLGQLRPAVEAGERAALRVVDADLENYRLAWQHALDQGPTDALPAGAAALLNYFDHRGRMEEGWRWLHEAAWTPRVRDDVGLHALLLSRASHMAYRLDRYADAEAGAQRVLAMARHDERDGAARVQALTVLAACALRLGHLDEARQRYQQLLARVKADGHAQQIAGTLDNLALVEKRSGRYDEALRLSLESLGQHRRIGHGPGIALCLNNLGSLYMVRDQAQAAEAPLREALAICERDGLGNTIALVLANLSQRAMKQGELDSAIAHADRALAAAQSSHNRGVWSWVRLHQVRLNTRTGNLDAALAGLGEGLSAALSLGAPSLLAPAILGFVELLDARRQTVLARRVLAFAADQPAMTMSDRDELRAQLARWGGAPGVSWPGMAFDELLERIAAEAAQAHAPLIAELTAEQRG